MIFEILSDISTFMIILIAAMVSYTQITMIITQQDNIDKHWRASYVLSLGELGDFETISATQFAIFIIFSFFVPLLLMNMLIAIMSDSYERVMANAIPADSR